jgi:hypothetical protein
MRALIYGMLRTGGLEESPQTIFQFLGMNGEVLTAYADCMEIFSDQTFQVEDIKKSKKPQDFQKSTTKKKQKQKESEEIGTPWSFYLYVALTLLNWSEGFFLKSTPNLWLKSYIHWLKTIPTLIHRNQSRWIKVLGGRKGALRWAKKNQMLILNFETNGEVSYAKTVKEINKEMNLAATEYKNQVSAMDKDATQTEKLTAAKQKLEKQVQLASQRTEQLREAYQEIS